MAKGETASWTRAASRTWLQAASAAQPLRLTDLMLLKTLKTALTQDVARLALSVPLLSTPPLLASGAPALALRAKAGSLDGASRSVLQALRPCHSSRHGERLFGSVRAGRVRAGKLSAFCSANTCLLCVVLRPKWQRQ